MQWQDPGSFSIQFDNKLTMDISPLASAQDVEDQLHQLGINVSVTKTDDGFNFDFYTQSIVTINQNPWMNILPNDSVSVHIKESV